MGRFWIGKIRAAQVILHALVLPLLLLLVGGGFPAAAAAQQIADDGRLLLDLRANLSDPSGSLRDWSSSTPFCNWTGITCGAGNATSGHLVIGISLPKSNLQGHISPSLGLLQALQALDLSKNNLTGSIPSEITRCTALTDVNLADNSLTGVIPADIGKLTGLITLRLSGNSLEGPIPSSVGRLTRLTRLNLDGNQLNSSIPREIGNCTQLKFFQAYSNVLSGLIPPEIGSLKRLTHLSLFQNRLSGPVPEQISGCASLSRVSLAENELTGAFPRLGNVTGLFELDISDNRLSGDLPGGLGAAWKQLNSLRMKGNKLTGSLPETFGGMVGLTELDVSSNGFGGQLPVNLGQLPLVVLRLFSNSFQGPLPPALGSAGSGLEELDVSGNRFSGGLPTALCSGQNLTLVNVSGNLLTGDLSPLSNCSSLQYLTASNNVFTAAFPLTLPGSLRLLDLSSNRFQGPVSPRIDELKLLRSLLLGNNSLSGSIPQGVGLLPLLESLNVSRNLLVGELPNLSSLTSLHTLDLSFNAFSGGIPPALGTFAQLETLDVSYNEFSGNIPPSLSQLTELKAYNFSNNRLSGQIPQIKASMPSSAFANNAALCGPPLAQPCTTTTAAQPPPPAAGTGRRRSRRESVARKVGLAFLVIGGALLAVTATFLLYTYRALKKSPGSRKLAAGQVAAENKFADRVPLLYAEIEKATEGFSDGNVIGAGPHGAVYRGIFAWEKILAVKVIRSEQEAEGDNNKNTYYYTAAARKLSRIRHPNVVKLEEFVIYKGVKIFLYEYMPNKSLGELLHRQTGPKLHWNTRYKIALGAAQGLSYLHHQQSIVHCDFKSSNVLLDSAFGARIADVGLAKLIKDSRNLACLNKSLGYTAPEAGKVSQKADVFGFGVVLLELLTGRHPVLEDGSCLGAWVRSCVADDHPLSDIVDPILKNVNGPFQEEMSTVCKVALICTDALPSRRPSMKQVVEVLSRVRKEPGGPKLRSLRSFIHSRSFVLLNTQDEDHL